LGLSRNRRETFRPLANEVDLVWKIESSSQLVISSGSFGRLGRHEISAAGDLLIAARKVRKFGLTPSM